MLANHHLDKPESRDTWSEKSPGQRRREVWSQHQKCSTVWHIAQVWKTQSVAHADSFAQCEALCCRLVKLSKLVECITTKLPRSKQLQLSAFFLCADRLQSRRGPSAHRRGEMPHFAFRVALSVVILQPWSGTRQDKRQFQADFFLPACLPDHHHVTVTVAGLRRSTEAQKNLELRSLTHHCIRSRAACWATAADAVDLWVKPEEMGDCCCAGLFRSFTLWVQRYVKSTTMKGCYKVSD